MRIKEILSDITDELSRTFEALDEAQLDELERRVLAANRVFVAAAGRSLLAIRGFAMRLMHFGFDAYVVGETVTPAIQPGDLLLIASGSGSTATLVVMAEKAKKVGADIALITTRPDSPLGKLADHIVHLEAYTAKLPDSGIKSVQLGGNTFEQGVLIVGDAIIIHIAGSSAEKNAELMTRHANLE
jgi:6-phospho-3-hexuloisomerase